MFSTPLKLSLCALLLSGCSLLLDGSDHMNVGDAAVPDDVTSDIATDIGGDTNTDSDLPDMCDGVMVGGECAECLNSTDCPGNAICIENVCIVCDADEDGFLAAACDPDPAELDCNDDFAEIPSVFATITCGCEQIDPQLTTLIPGSNTGGIHKGTPILQALEQADLVSRRPGEWFIASLEGTDGKASTFSSANGTNNTNTYSNTTGIAPGVDNTGYIVAQYKDQNLNYVAANDGSVVSKTLQSLLSRVSNLAVIPRRDSGAVVLGEFTSTGQGDRNIYWTAPGATDGWGKFGRDDGTDLSHIETAPGAAMFVRNGLTRLWTPTNVFGGAPTFVLSGVVTAHPIRWGDDLYLMMDGQQWGEIIPNDNGVQVQSFLTFPADHPAVGTFEFDIATPPGRDYSFLIQAEGTKVYALRIDSDSHSERVELYDAGSSIAKIQAYASVEDENSASGLVEVGILVLTNDSMLFTGFRYCE